jgi:hypothetical protein
MVLFVDRQDVNDIEVTRIRSVQLKVRTAERISPGYRYVVIRRQYSR